MSNSPASAPADPVRDAIVGAMARAPREECFTVEQRAELDQAMEDLAAGRAVMVPDAEIPAWLERHARDLGEIEQR